MRPWTRKSFVRNLTNGRYSTGSFGEELSALISLRKHRGDVLFGALIMTPLLAAAQLVTSASFKGGCKSIFHSPLHWAVCGVVVCWG
mmetsp:Transcript_29605/g.87768  ORF Transcript_29605/g.87768 Transcript_29605/m.87768 type:complete len:87 (-) Transcript_29605:386-646(-)